MRCRLSFGALGLEDICFNNFHLVRHVLHPNSLRYPFQILGNAIFDHKGLGIDIKNDARTNAVYKGLAAQGKLEISILLIDGKPLAFLNNAVIKVPSCAFLSMFHGIRKVSQDLAAECELVKALDSVPGPSSWDRLYFF